jgi:hypothetical protein
MNPRWLGPHLCDLVPDDGVGSLCGQLEAGVHPDFDKHAVPQRRYHHVGNQAHQRRRCVSQSLVVGIGVPICKVRPPALLEALLWTGRLRGREG